MKARRPQKATPEPPQQPGESGLSQEGNTVSDTAASDEITVLDLGEGVEWAGVLTAQNDPRV
jgi:hypothetical protein